MACDCRAWQNAYARRTGYPSWAYEAAVEIQRANKYFSHPAAERMARIIAEKAR